VYADAEVVPIYRSRNLILAENYAKLLRDRKVYQATVEEYEAWKTMLAAHQFEMQGV
jgi:hypothetical protein